MSSQVKRKAAEADEMIRQLAAQANGEAEQSEQEEQGEEQQETADVVAMPTSEEENSDQGDQAPAYSDDEIAELKEAARKADARWRSLQGQIDSKDRQIEQLHALLSNMQSAPEQTPAAEAAPTGHTKEDVENFGDDMIDVVQRIARQVAASVIQQELGPLRDELKSVSTVTASTVQDSFEGKLTKLAPNWEILNADEKFIAWLQESKTRLDMFQTAASNKDAVATADFFNMYDKLNAPAAQRQQEKKERLQKQVAPGKARSTTTTAATTSTEEKTWTRSEIADFYKSKKQYTPEEFNRLEREIAKAMSDGRVDYSS